MNEDHPNSLPPSGPPLPKPPRPPGAIPLPNPPRPIPAWALCFWLAVFGAMAVQMSTQIFHHYGYGVFVAVPVALGFLAARVAEAKAGWNWGLAFQLAFLTTLLTGLFLFLPMVEGAICLAMAAVVATPFVVVGVLLAQLFKRVDQSSGGRTSRNLHSFILIALPVSMALETHVAPPPPILEQTTSIEINAPPEQVWQYIPSFRKIESPPTRLLKLGLAYPLASEMTGEGVGAARRCILSTGPMPEVITVWEPGKRLEFDVLATPKAMEETHPFGEVKAAHDEGYFLCKHGRFVLTALPNGRTLVEGTSWFQHDLWPQFYWAPLTKEVVHEVHERVLQHIKALAEKDASR